MSNEVLKIIPVLNISFKTDYDIMQLRNRLKKFFGFLKLSNLEYTKIITALSEITRNAVTYAGGGILDLSFIKNQKSQFLQIIIKDNGPGIKNLDDILNGNYKSDKGNGIGIVGAKKISEFFEIKSKPEEGTVVILRKYFLDESIDITYADITRLTEDLIKEGPNTTLDEMQQKNKELLEVLETLKRHEIQLEEKNDKLLKLNLEFEKNSKNIQLLNDEIESKNQQLKSINNELQNFAYTVSHDLKDPLRKIMHYIDLIYDNNSHSITEDSKKYFNYVTTSAQRMKNLIEGLLSYALVGIKKSDFRKVNCKSIVDIVLSNLSETINEKNAEIIVKKLPVVKGNYQLLIQLFQNLIGNALKFVDVQKPVVEIGSLKSDKINIKLPDDQNNSNEIIKDVIYVKDNGIGISNSLKDKIFVIFSRGHSSSKFPGSGIGLATCKKIVEEHNGKIWFEPNKNNGSIFYFTLN